MPFSIYESLYIKLRPWNPVAKKKVQPLYVQLTKHCTVYVSTFN